MDKTSTVSSQAVLEMPSFSVDIRLLSSWPLVKASSKIDFQDRTRHRWAAVSIHPHYGFVCGRHDAAWQPRSRNPQDWDLGCLEATAWTKNFGVSWRSSSTVARAWRSVPVHCPAGTKSLPDTLRIAGSSMTSLWRRAAASKKPVRDITSISCFVTTMKLPHALQIYSTVFVKKCMRLHFSR